MKRYLSEKIRTDLKKKMVLLTGPRQVGKTTLAKDLMAGYQRPQYLNWDVSDDRRLLLDQSWSPRADILVFDEIHKMPNWKAYLKGVFDGRSEGQAILSLQNSFLKHKQFSWCANCVRKNTVVRYRFYREQSGWQSLWHKVLIPLSVEERYSGQMRNLMTRVSP